MMIHQANNTEILSFGTVTLFFVQRRVFPNTCAKRVKPYSIKSIVSPLFFNQLRKKTMRYKRVRAISLALLDHLCKSLLWTFPLMRKITSDSLTWYIYIYISEISLNLYNYVNSREAIHRVICRLIIIIIVVVVVYRLSIRLLNSSLRMSSFATRIIHTSKTLWQNRAKFSLRWFRITRLHVVPFNNKFRFGKIFFVMSWLSRPNFISTNHLSTIRYSLELRFNINFQLLNFVSINFSLNFIHFIVNIINRNCTLLISIQQHQQALFHSLHSKLNAPIPIFVIHKWKVEKVQSLNGLEK